MEDLIRREDAIKAVSEPFDRKYWQYTTRSIRDTVKALKDIPSAEKQGEWVPCSERLPEEVRTSYWICTDDGYQCQCRWTNVNPFWSDLTTDWHWNPYDFPQYSEVVAWMPLPEPYKESE